MVSKKEITLSSEEIEVLKKTDAFIVDKVETRRTEVLYQLQRLGNDLDGEFCYEDGSKDAEKILKKIKEMEEISEYVFVLEDLLRSLGEEVSDDEA